MKNRTEREKRQRRKDGQKGGETFGQINEEKKHTDSQTNRLMDGLMDRQACGNLF